MLDVREMLERQSPDFCGRSSGLPPPLGAVVVRVHMMGLLWSSPLTDYPPPTTLLRSVFHQREDLPPLQFVAAAEEGELDDKGEGDDPSAELFNKGTDG